MLGLQFVDNIRRPDRDNAIDIYTSDEYEDVLADGVWQNTFKVKPEVLTAEEKAAWIAQMSGVTVGSDAFHLDFRGTDIGVERSIHRLADKRAFFLQVEMLQNLKIQKPSLTEQYLLP